MTLCYQLSETSGDNVDEQAKEASDDDAAAAAQQLERQDLFLARADTVIRPLFRYCQYELKQVGKAVVEEPRHTSSKNTKKDTQQQQQKIVFRGQELVLESKELRVLLLKLQSLQNTVDDEQQDAKEESSFLKVLGILDDALEVVQTLLSSLDTIASTGPSVQAKRKGYLLWKAYLTSQKTLKVMEHTEGLLDGIDKNGHAERVHVYDALLQHAKALLVLPGVPQEQTEEDEFALQVQANTLRFRAFKCFHMAMFYYLRPRKFAAALSLLDHSAKLASQAEEEIAACDEDMPHADDYLSGLESLRQSIGSCKIAVQAATCLQQGNRDSRLATDRPLMLRLEDEDCGLLLAGQPLPIPMHCKPVFYDLAYDHALDSSSELGILHEFCGHEAEPTLVDEESKSENAAATSSSLFGWLSGSR